jgi:hypothetical protein
MLVYYNAGLLVIVCETNPTIMLVVLDLSVSLLVVLDINIMHAIFDLMKPHTLPKQIMQLDNKKSLFPHQKSLFLHHAT